MKIEKSTFKNMLDNVCEKALLVYGIDNQLDKAVEELYELIEECETALEYSVNLTGIAEEIADVMIMINQLIIHYGIDNKVNEYIELKLHKLEQRMQREEE